MIVFEHIKQRKQKVFKTRSVPDLFFAVAFQILSWDINIHMLRESFMFTEHVILYPQRITQSVFAVTFQIFLRNYFVASDEWRNTILRCLR